MAAPVPLIPVLPVGTFLVDGYQTLVGFEQLPSIALWITAEGGAKAPSLDTGEQINITSMHNKRMRTFAAPSLLTQGDNTFTCFYDPAVLDDLLLMLGFEQTITFLWPDGSTWAFFGFLKKFEPGENKEKTAPTATCTITAISRDPAENP